MHTVQSLAVWFKSTQVSVMNRLRDEHGEGVISAAIAVLIFAFLGLAMWVAFELIFTDATDRTRTAVQETGR